jgi:hypothetical protein
MIRNNLTIGIYGSKILLSYTRKGNHMIETAQMLALFLAALPVAAVAIYAAAKYFKTRAGRGRGGATAGLTSLDPKVDRYYIGEVG